jgi:hypothetical protein
MNQRTRAHGRAAHATLRWLHGRDVPDISLHRPVELGDDAAASGRDQIEERIRLALAVPAAEMMHMGAPTTHIAADRPEVQHALRHAGRLPGDPVDRIERCLDDLLATLHSPKVRHTVTKLASALVRAPAGTMSAEDVLERIILAMGETPAGDHPAHPRTIWIR